MIIWSTCPKKNKTKTIKKNIGTSAEPVRRLCVKSFLWVISIKNILGSKVLYEYLVKKNEIALREVRTPDLELTKRALYH